MLALKPPCTNIRETEPYLDVEAICDIFVGVIEEHGGDTPWADASHNDLMRQARVIHQKMREEPFLNVYEECMELIALYDEE